MSHPKTIFHLLQQQVPVVFKFTFSKNGLPWIRIFHIWGNMREPGVAELLRQFVTKWEDVMKAWYTWLSLILLEPAHVTSKNQKPQEMAVLRFLWLFLNWQHNIVHCFGKLPTTLPRMTELLIIWTWWLETNWWGQNYFLPPRWKIIPLPNYRLS